MIGEVLGDFASAIARLNDAELFSGLGMALFGLAAVTLMSRLRNGGRDAVQPETLREHDQAA